MKLRRDIAAYREIIRRIDEDIKNECSAISEDVHARFEIVMALAEAEEEYQSYLHNP